MGKKKFCPCIINLREDDSEQLSSFPGSLILEERAPSTFQAGG
jgi:hypothetical protein